MKLNAGLITSLIQAVQQPGVETDKPSAPVLFVSDLEWIPPQTTMTV